MAIIFGIDGVRVVSRKGQSNTHRNSFVRRIVENSSSVSQERRYLSGPSGASGSLDESIENGYSFVRSRFRAAQGDSPVLLTGFSRGAAGIITLSRRLEKRNVPVKAILLFDAVDKFASSGVSSIPNSVKNVLHVRRHPESKSMPGLASVGKRSSSPTVYEEKLFKCTHAAMGGMPWSWEMGQTPSDLIDEASATASFGTANRSTQTTITFTQEESVSKEVWNYVQAFRGKHRFL